MKKAIRIFVILAIALLFVGTLVFLYSKSKGETIEYNIESAFITNIEKKTVATGKVVPRKEIEIKPQGVSGIIEKLYVEPGQMLKKGDKIARIKIIPDMLSLNAAESRLRRSKINFEDAQINFKRNKSLFDKQVISQIDFQKTQLNFRSAQEELEASKNNLQLIKEGVSKNSSLATNTIIRSTIDGMLLDIPVKEGNSVIQSNTFNAGTTVAIVADMGEMIFEGKVDETEVGKINQGMIIELTIGAIQDIKFKAKLEYISPKGVEENGAIQFEIKAAVSLENDHFIRSGYSANADIVLDKRNQVLAVNEALIEFRNDSTFVEIEIENQKFEKRYIETGLSDGINIEIIKGITIDDKLKGSKKTKLDRIKQNKKDMKKRKTNKKSTED